MQFKLFFFGLCLVGCAHTSPVLLPVPDNHTRPVLTEGFYNCVEENPEVVCLSFEDAQTLMLYMVDIETDLRKCAITVEEENQARKK